MAIAATPACRRPGVAQSFPQAPVVLISIDTLRSDRLPAYGYAGVATPHLDRFRRDALLFESAWSPCPMTLPSHVTMLTGLLPPEHGVRNNVGFAFDSARHPHLPGLLKAHGYATGAAVSSYVLRGETGLAALFDEYEDSLDPRHGTGFADQQRPGGVTLGFAKRWLDAHAAEPRQQQKAHLVYLSQAAGDAHINVCVAQPVAEQQFAYPSNNLWQTPKPCSKRTIKIYRRHIDYNRVRSGFNKLRKYCRIYGCHTMQRRRKRTNHDDRMLH